MALRQTMLMVVAVLTLALGCVSRSTGEAPSQKPPLKLTTADLKQLRWIEGSWRGTGDTDKPFFERYRFESDSTLAVDSFADETLAKVTETTRFQLKDGEFSGGSEGSIYTAVAFDDRSIEFGPAVNVSNSFRWERESNDVWKATIILPATANKPARQRVYKMERWPKPATP